MLNKFLAFLKNFGTKAYSFENPDFVQIGKKFEADLAEITGNSDFRVPGVNNGHIGQLIYYIRCLKDKDILYLFRIENVDHFAITVNGCGIDTTIPGIKNGSFAKLLTLIQTLGDEEILILVKV